MPRFADAAVRRLVSLDPFPQPPLVRLRYPVMMMHGFGMLGAWRRAGLLHEEAMHLRLHGVWAVAPNVTPYNTIAIRAAQWHEHLHTFLDATGADRVNLIAHSMGGLDARHLIHALDAHPHVASLTTIASPHRGSAIAEIVLSQPDRLRNPLTQMMDWLGNTAFEPGEADVLQALHELTPEHVQHTFNPATPDHPDVQYWSYAGLAGKGTRIAIHPFLRVGNALLHAREGLNDGFVSVESAKWGAYQGALEADHARQIGLQLRASHRFDSNAFYLTLVEKLAANGL